jgi:2'-5' RNA ligase
MEEIRAFIAIELPDEVGKLLDDARQVLARKLVRGGVRWVKTSNIHLTLRFLGNAKSDQLPVLYDGLDKAASRCAPFSLVLDSLGCFPNPRRPRVIWVGLNGELSSLNSLYREVEKMLADNGWEVEGRGYHPHLTLGRVKDSTKVVEAQFPWGVRLASGEIDVDAVHLIESQLLPSGAVYSIRHSGYLTG